MLSENICEVWDWTGKDKNIFINFGKVVAKKLLEKTTEPILNKNGFMKKKKLKAI